MADFDEYTRESEPHKKAKSYAWQTAIGLQAVDGDISIKEAQQLISKYYESKTDHDSDKDDTEEADKVASHIAQILSERTFNFSPFYFTGIHKRLFEGVFKHAGEFRKYNITKKEWVLHGDTVLYSDAGFLKETLDYDFTQEKEFSYKGLSVDEVIKHLCKFISGIWQIHVFGEGNTRTTAVFTIKYLRTLGFHVTNDAFAKNSLSCSSAT